MKRMIELFSSLSEWTGRAVSWLTTLLVVVVCLDVVIRKVLNQTQAWVMELEWHLFGVIFLFGAAYALKHHKHVRVDLFYEKFSPRERALVNLVGGVCFLIPWCIMIIIVTSKFAYQSWLIGEGSPDGGLPARYLIKAAIPVGFVLLLLQALAETGQAYLDYRQVPSEQ